MVPLRAVRLLALAASLALPVEARPGRGSEDGAPVAAAAVRYRLVYRDEEGDRDWHVTLEADGLDAAAEPVQLALEDWGEWTEVDAYYLRGLESEPPLRPVEGRHDAWEVEGPHGWDGRLRVQYTLATVPVDSGAREHHGLLPWRAPTYVMGFTANTLMGISAGDLHVERHLAIDVPAGWTIATGAGGVSRTHQECALPDGYGNGVVSFGRPVATAHRVIGAKQNTVPLEIVQWGGDAPVADALADFAETCLAAYTESLGVPPTHALSLLVTEPGMGGTSTFGSIALGCPDSLDGHQDPYTAHFLAHELFHDWLGTRLKGPDESLAWFWEGFTEYLSLWHLAATGLVDRSWFADRMGDFRESMQGNERWNDVAYADPGVNWRDPAIEPLAYQGSALLALDLDVRLRRDGSPGLLQLLRDLLRAPDGRYDLDAIHGWLADHDQGAFWDDCLAGTERPDLDADLAFAGYDLQTVDVPLTYLGIRLDTEGGWGKVVAIDPDGPAADSGLVIGDVVVGRSPFRREEVEIDASVTTEYRYGLALYDPTAEECSVYVSRDGEETELPVVPRRIPGGHEQRRLAVPERQAAFFE